MHARLTKYYIGALLCALFAGAVFPSARAGSGDQMSMTGSLLEESAVRIEELHTTFLPKLRTRILSLTLQGAPVPQELAELLTQSEELSPENLASFEGEAQRILGASWETAWEEEEVSGTLAERWRVYLAQVIEEAPALAARSPHAAEDIRALTTDLIARIQEAEKKGEDIRALLPLLRDRLAELLPTESTHSLETFRNRADSVLLELPDALSLLLPKEERKRADLTTRASALRASLPLLSSSKDIVLFREYFTALEEELLDVTPEVPLAQLRMDFEALLQNLASTLHDAEKVPLPVSEPLDAVNSLLEEVRHMESESDLTTVLSRLEDILQMLQETDIPPLAPRES